MTKTLVQETNIRKETFSKVCGSLGLRPATTPINSKTNHAAYQLILKSRTVQQFAVSVLRFKTFSKNFGGIVHS